MRMMSEGKGLNIIIAGAPASGKGTQCEVIKEKFEVVHLSTGDILRAAVKDQTELGKKAKAFMDAGQLVPDELIIDVVSDRLRQQDCQSKGWLLDGFPRTKSQADALTKAGMVPDCLILLDVPEEVLVERVVGRRTDPVTGKIYHMKFSPPENEEIKERLIQRSDDTEEKIKVRFKEFLSHIDAIKSCYAPEMIKVIDGKQSSSSVTQAVTTALNDAQKKKSKTRLNAVASSAYSPEGSKNQLSQTALGMTLLIIVDNVAKKFFASRGIAF
jgi:adenylate kinase